MFLLKSLKMIAYWFNNDVTGKPQTAYIKNYLLKFQTQHEIIQQLLDRMAYRLILQMEYASVKAD